MSATQAQLDSIAYIAWHDHRVLVEESGHVIVGQADRPDLRNYAGSGHAGALYTLAETAAGITADGVARPMGGFILLAAAQVRYTRRAVGDLQAEAVLDPAIDRQALAREFEASGKGRARVAVTIRDPDHEAVFEGHFDYAIRRRKT